MSLNYLATRFQCTWPWEMLVMLCDGRIVCGCADPYAKRVLGDARTNGRDPAEAAFAAITEQAGRTFWLNPEPSLYWDYGDSVISRYAAHCKVYECWTADQLEGFVAALTGVGPAPDPVRPQRR